MQTKQYTPERAQKTLWNGVWFDSALEARWAKLFHLLDWKWQKPEYKNGFPNWLPDFRIVTPDNSVYLVEVKPSVEFVDFKKFNEALRQGYTVATCYTQPLATNTILWRKEEKPLVCHFPHNINELWAEAEWL